MVRSCSLLTNKGVVDNVMNTSRDDERGQGVPSELIKIRYEYIVLGCLWGNCLTLFNHMSWFHDPGICQY